MAAHAIVKVLSLWTFDGCWIVCVSLSLYKYEHYNSVCPALNCFYVIIVIVYLTQYMYVQFQLS